jgi:hypothetical protein
MYTAKNLLNTISQRSISASYPTNERPVTGCKSNERAFDCDRRAILAMLGEYQVSFNFNETVVLKPGYERKDPKHAGGFETVVLVEDNGSSISMQHILVAGDTVVKHWRQDWVFEQPSHWTYVGDQRFEHRERDPDAVPGTWTQLVYEVDDGPRYTGSGRWNHRYGASTWTSERTWRPLPRREYTTRLDYQLLNVENRHTITPQGWTHEQDNTKVIRNNVKDVVLVRESGFNDYRRISGFDFSEGLAYWKETIPFWSAVRARWDKALSDKNTLILAFPTGDSNLNTAVLSLADEYRTKPDSDAHLSAFKTAFDKYVRTESFGKK